MSEMPIFERAVHVARVLDRRGFLQLRPDAWPGATGDEVSRALERFWKCVEHLSETRLLHVDRAPDGTITLSDVGGPASPN